MGWLSDSWLGRAYNGVVDWTAEEVVTPLLYPHLDEANEALAKPAAQRTQQDERDLQQFEREYQDMEENETFQSLADTGERMMEHMDDGHPVAALVEGAGGLVRGAGTAAKEAFNSVANSVMNWDISRLLALGGGGLGGMLLGDALGGGLVTKLAFAGAGMFAGSYIQNHFFGGDEAEQAPAASGTNPAVQFSENQQDVTAPTSSTAPKPEASTEPVAYNMASYRPVPAMGMAA